MAESISVFFPAFNDANTIPVVVRDALDLLPALTNDYEVLVIDDGSIDETPALLDELARTCPRLKIIHHPGNLGYGAALRSGFTHSSKDLVFYTDGDGQFDVRELRSLLALMGDGIDVVNGFKANRADGRHRKIAGAIYNRLAHFFFNLPIRDVDCDFRLLRRSALRQIELNESSGAICIELVHKLSAAGCVFAETPVRHYPRRHGRSKFFRFRSVAQTMLDFFGLWWKLVVSHRSASPQYVKTVAENAPAPDGVSSPVVSEGELG